MAVLRTELHLSAMKWDGEIPLGANRLRKSMSVVDESARDPNVSGVMLTDYGWLDCVGRFLLPSDPTEWKWDDIGLVAIEGFTSYVPSKKSKSKFASRLQTNQIAVIQNIGRLRAECYMRDVPVIVLSPQKIKSAMGIPQTSERKVVERLRRSQCVKWVPSASHVINKVMDRDEVAALNTAIAAGRIAEYVC